MTSIHRFFQDVKDAAELQSRQKIQNFISSIKALNKLQDQQKAANLTTLQTQIKSTIPILQQSVRRLAQSSQGMNTARVLNELKHYRQWIPRQFNRERGQISAIIADVTDRIKNKEQQRFIQRQFDKKIIDTATKKQSNVIQDFKKAKKNQIISGQNPTTSIQNNIRPISKIIDQKIPMIVATMDKVPQSVRWLDKFAVAQGYQGMGSTSDKPGRGYIGRWTTQQGNKQYILPYPQTKNLPIQTPDILANFKYYAGKTINSWNDFVCNENKLIQFSNKVATRELRKQFVAEKIQGMNISTFCAQALASLVYYYVQIPMELFIRNKNAQYDGTKQSFIQKYTCGQTASKNPFLYDSNTAIQIFKILFGLVQIKGDMQFQGISVKSATSTNPRAVFIKICRYLQNNQNKINKLRISQFKNYPQKKKGQSIQFFTTIGIHQDQIKKVLNSDQLGQIKTKKFILPSMLTNNEYLDIISKIQNKSQKDPQTKWVQEWGSTQLKCYDYIWNYQL